MPDKSNSNTEGILIYFDAIENRYESTTIEHRIMRVISVERLNIAGLFT
jgi:hypothetical protein